MEYLTSAEREVEKERVRTSIETYLSSLTGEASRPIKAVFYLKFPNGYKRMCRTNDLYSYLKRVFRELMKPNGYTLDYQWTQTVRRTYGGRLLLEDILEIEVEIVWRKEC